MLTQVSHRGPMCPLMVASHNEDSVHQATKRYEVGDWEIGGQRVVDVEQGEGQCGPVGSKGIWGGYSKYLTPATPAGPIGPS